MSSPTIELDSELDTSISMLAERLKRSRHSIVEEALRDFIARHQKEEKRRQDTQVAVQSVVAGRTVDGDTVHAWLRSWGTDNELQPPTL